MVQPAGILARMNEGPLVGLPFCTDPWAQVGRPGMVTNFISETFCPDDCFMSCPRADIETSSVSDMVRAEKKNLLLVLILLSLRCVEFNANDLLVPLVDFEIEVAGCPAAPSFS